MNNFVDTVKERIQNANLTAIINIVAPKIELAIRSKNASSGQEATSVATNSERGEHVGIKASFENASGNINVQQVPKGNDEARNNIPAKRFNRQTHTYHMATGQTTQTNQFPEFLIGGILTPRNPPSHQLRTCQHKYHKKTIYQWSNEHQEIKTRTQTTPLTV